MGGSTGAALDAVGVRQLLGQRRRQLPLHHRTGDEAPHGPGHLRDRLTRLDAEGGDGLGGPDHPSTRVDVVERGDRGHHVDQLGPPVVVRRHPQTPHQGQVVGVGQRVRRSDGHPPIGQGPARPVPPGVLDPEIQDRRVRHRPARGGRAIQLLGGDPVTDDLLPCEVHLPIVDHGSDNTPAPRGSLTPRECPATRSRTMIGSGVGSPAVPGHPRQLAVGRAAELDLPAHGGDLPHRPDLPWLNAGAESAPDRVRPGCPAGTHPRRGDRPRCTP